MLFVGALIGMFDARCSMSNVWDVVLRQIPE